MHALELRDPRRVIPSVANARSMAATTTTVKRPRRVRKALLAALGLSMLVHVLWTFWPVDTTPPPESTVLTATLTEMPPPPVPSVEAPVAPAPAARATRPPSRRIAAATRHPVAAPDVQAAPADDVARGSGDAAPAPVERTLPGAVTAAPEPADTAANEPPPRALPPRVDLAYKVFLGTQGFMIGDATYRFEHSGDRYRISTVGQARGLAALLVRGTGKVESQGRITANGLRPYEFAIERGSADRREVAFFDWEAGNVVLHDGATAALEPPAFDPLTILWQPYFSPPGGGDQTFSLATTRKVARYTLTRQGEETITWQRGEIVTERWHRRSDDGNTDAWFWLAPSMHYIPVKMRVTRTSRGTLEVLLDAIRVDDPEAYGLPAALASAEHEPAATTPNPVTTSSDIVYGMPGSGLPPMRAEDLHGQ
jgi:hypothetical protein